jgi:hypothetical protein
MKPLIKCFAALLLTLLIPNGLIIGFFMYWVATYYWEVGRVELLITNQDVFLILIGQQTFFVSIYSLVWAAFIYPRISSWLRFWKTLSQTRPSQTGTVEKDQPIQQSQPDQSV